MAAIGSVALLVFLAIFGLRILIGFSLLVDRIRGNTPQTQQQTESLQPPVLDPLPEATNSATLTVRGRAKAKLTVVLTVNAKEYKSLPVGDDGTFEVSDIPVSEGQFSASAIVTDDKNGKSSPSQDIRTIIDRTAPKLEIAAPEDHATVNDGTHRVGVQGITDADVRVTINDRIAVVRSDGSFTYSMPLNDGENKLSIVARDIAGNETKAERTVTYQP